MNFPLHANRGSVNQHVLSKLLSIYNSETAYYSVFQCTKLQGTHRQWVCSVHINKEQGCSGNSLVLEGLERLHLHHLQHRIKWKIHYNDSAQWTEQTIIIGIVQTWGEYVKQMIKTINKCKNKRGNINKDNEIALTWSRVALWDTAGTHSRIRRTRPDFTSFRVYHWNRDVHLLN